MCAAHVGCENKTTQHIIHSGQYTDKNKRIMVPSVVILTQGIEPCVAGICIEDDAVGWFLCGRSQLRDIAASRIDDL